VFKRSELANGLRILTSSIPSVRSVSVGMFVGTGSRYEDDSSAGISHFLEHILFKGTATRPEPQMISGAIESVGGVLNASTDREATVYWAKVAVTHCDLALDLLSDMIMNPIMLPVEIERERGVIIEELAMTYDQPDALVELLIDSALWPDHPMGRDVGGNRDTVRAIDRQQLVRYHSKWYVPSNLVVAVAGNIDHDQIVDRISHFMGSWSGRRITPLEKGSELTISQPISRVVLGRRRTDQAHLSLAFHGVSRSHERRYDFDVLNTILGEGMTSRLFMEVRERQGLAYEIYSTVAHYTDCGALNVACGVETSNVDRAVEAIIGQIDRLQHTVSSADIQRAIDYSLGRLMLRLEDTGAVMAWIGGQELLHGRVLTPEEVEAELRLVTPDRLTEVIQEYLCSDRARLAIVGPYRSEARFERLLSN
jgi:predicted Zn-dependent peptidase